MKQYNASYNSKTSKSCITKTELIASMCDAPAQLTHRRHPPPSAISLEGVTTIPGWPAAGAHAPHTLETIEPACRAPSPHDCKRRHCGNAGPTTCIQWKGCSVTRGDGLEVTAVTVSWRVKQGGE